MSLYIMKDMSDSHSCLGGQEVCLKTVIHLRLRLPLEISLNQILQSGHV